MDNTDGKSSLSSETEVGSQEETFDLIVHRKKLIPTWIKVFGYIFLVLAIFVPISLIYSSVTGELFTFEFLGLHVVGGPTTPGVIVMNLIFIAFGVSAYGLLFGKDWGVNACLATGYIGVFIAIVTMLLSIASGFYVLRLEPLVQIPYIIKLHQIRDNWNFTKKPNKALNN